MKKFVFFAFCLICLQLYSNGLDSLKAQSPSYTELILGGMPVKNFVVYILFGYIGMALNLLGNLWSDSENKVNLLQWQRNLVTIMVVPIAILFANEMFGLELTNFNSVLIGGFADSWITKLKRKNVLTLK